MMEEFFAKSWAAALGIVGVISLTITAFITGKRQGEDKADFQTKKECDGRFNTLQRNMVTTTECEDIRKQQAKQCYFKHVPLEKVIVQETCDARYNSVSHSVKFVQYLLMEITSPDQQQRAKTKLESFT